MVNIYYLDSRYKLYSLLITKQFLRCVTDISPPLLRRPINPALSPGSAAISGYSPWCRREVVTVMRRRLNRMGSALPGKLRHLQVSALGSEMFRLSSLHILRLSRHILAASVKTGVRTPAAWRWCRWPRCGGSSARCPGPRSRCGAPPRTDTWTRAARGTRPRQELRIVGHSIFSVVDLMGLEFLGQY